MAKNSPNEHPLVAAKRDAEMTYELLAVRSGFSAGYLRQVGSGARRPRYDVAYRLAGLLDPHNRDALAAEIMRYPYRPVPESSKTKKKAKSRTRRKVAS